MRCRDSGSTTPSRTSITGLIDSIDPSIACAPPTRPPFLRFSSVSSAPYTRVRGTSASAADATWPADWPSAARRAASTAIIPRPIETESESTTRTSISPSSALAAICAAWMVAERREEMLMQTIAPAPSAATRRKTSSNAPGGGAAVSGRTADDVQRDQNSAGERS